MVTCGHRFRPAFSIKSSVFQAKSCHDRELFCVVTVLAKSAQPQRQRKRETDKQNKHYESVAHFLQVSLPLLHD